jgi:bifunctional N-acetylglucosamine-1-phosphate-uridyltransferase/glucosamine-1-phosphate-acetyltransferase GlmU-like protein
MELYVTIMAGGLGKRMNSTIPKVLHPIITKTGEMIPMIINLIRNILMVKPLKILIIVGKYKNLIDATMTQYLSLDELNQCHYIIQDNPLGTGHAIRQTLDFLKLYPNGINLILSGDVPLITNETIQELFNTFIYSGKSLLITGFEPDNINGFGRIINNNNSFLEIVEDQDCTPEQRKIKLCHAGIYMVLISTLFQYIPQITTNNKSGEYYLTDIVKIMNLDQKNKIHLMIIPPNKTIEFLGINTIEQLNAINIQLKSNYGLILDNIIVKSYK